MAVTIELVDKGPTGFSLVALYDGDQGTGDAAPVPNAVLVAATKTGGKLRKVFTDAYANAGDLNNRLAQRDVRITAQVFGGVATPEWRVTGALDAGDDNKPILVIAPGAVASSSQARILVEYVHSVVQ